VQAFFNTTKALELEPGAILEEANAALAAATDTGVLGVQGPRWPAQFLLGREKRTREFCTEWACRTNSATKPSWDGKPWRPSVLENVVGCLVSIWHCKGFTLLSNSVGIRMFRCIHPVASSPLPEGTPLLRVFGSAADMQRRGGEHYQDFHWQAIAQAAGQSVSVVGNHCWYCLH